MSTLILTHVVTGLAGIATGTDRRRRNVLPKAVGGLERRIPVDDRRGVCDGPGFLPTVGVTSAQLVAFFVSFLLVIAAYARYVRRLNRSWNQVYAFTAVGALFLNILITTAQSFLHIRALKALAPTQTSPVFVAVKVSLLLVFIVVAVVTARRAGRS